MREQGLIAKSKCKRCFQKFPIQYLKGGLCKACRKDLGFDK